jgi:hypothetical protein
VNAWETQRSFTQTFSRSAAMPTLAWACVQAAIMATPAWPWHPNLAA